MSVFIFSPCIDEIRDFLFFIGFSIYPALFKMILSGADLSMLEIFLDNLDDVDSGKQTFDQARTGLGHLLHDKYVKDKLKK